MSKIDKYSLGEVRYCDCLNPINGLSTLPDKSIDLCFTDPPFNIEYFAKFTKQNYNDTKKNYDVWCKKWFNELQRICFRIVIHCGIQNENMWYDIKKPVGRAYLLKKNSRSGGKISQLNCLYPLIFYGQIINRLKTDYFTHYSLSGFLRKKNPISSLIHPCPINPFFLMDLFSQLQPKSVIDPFLGSGTTAEICTKLGIPWLGYEINDVYSVDIDKRLKNCKLEPKQITLF